MANVKRRSKQQIMEEKSVDILRKTLPEEWVIHDYKPDYGIDFVIEVFRYLDGKKEIAETLGEQFFIQLKSVESTVRKNIKIFPRSNVEKSKPMYHKDEFKEIQVVKFKIDVSLLMTVESMGSALPVLLMVVDLSTEDMFYICLNDYIDKIILPENKNYFKQESVIINIPVDNRITAERHTLTPLEFYAKRTKLFGAFQKISYQADEVRYNTSLETMIYFIEKILKYDFWENTPIWFSIEHTYKNMKLLYEIAVEENSNLQLEKIIQLVGITDLPEEKLIEMFVVHYLKGLWVQLNNLGCLYEEYCREWFLPIY